MKKQLVYLPTKVEDELPNKNHSDELHSDCGLVGFENGVFGKWDTNRGVWNYPIKVRTWLKEQNGYFFTPEELNEYTEKVIKEALESAAEKVTTKLRDDYMELHMNDDWSEIDKQSIIDTFQETFKKFKV